MTHRPLNYLVACVAAASLALASPALGRGGGGGGGGGHGGGGFGAGGFGGGMHGGGFGGMHAGGGFAGMVDRAPDPWICLRRFHFPSSGQPLTVRSCATTDLCRAVGQN